MLLGGHATCVGWPFLFSASELMTSRAVDATVPSTPRSGQPRNPRLHGATLVEPSADLVSVRPG